MRYIILTILFFVSTLQIQAQNPKIDKARTLLNAGKTQKAISLLSKYYKKTSDKATALEIISIYNQLNQTEKALVWAEKIGINNVNEQSDAIQYVDLLIKNGAFQEALEFCKSYALENDTLNGIDEKAYTCENLLRAKSKSILYDVEEAIFNSAGDDISISNYRRNYVVSSNGYIVGQSGNINPEYFDSLARLAE